MAVTIDIRHNRGDALARACAVLARGLPVAIPTETVYGLAADATNPEAIARIYQTKGRPQFNPLICHMSDLAMAQKHAEFDPLSLALAEAFWPGPLTLVVPRKTESPIHDLATAGLDTVGIRVPEGFAAELIAAFGQPLAAPSANTSGKISPTSAEHVDADLGDRIELILDAGSSGIGVESTIIKVEDGKLLLLRPGGLAVEQIEALTGQPVKRVTGHATVLLAPGMMQSHYAPGALMRLNATTVEPGEALIRFGAASVENADTAVADFNLSPSGDLLEASRNLFSMMKLADASGASRIAVTPVPMDGLGEAINDRLARAAAPRP